MPHLLIQDGDGKPRRIELQWDRITVGRNPDNDLVLGNASVSGHHAEIVREDGTSKIRDLGSANGTMLNGQAVQEAPLKSGDKITFGPVETKFVQGDAAKGVWQNLRTGIAGASGAFQGGARLLKTKIEKLMRMLISVGDFVGVKEQETKSPSFDDAFSEFIEFKGQKTSSRSLGGAFSGLKKMITPVRTKGISLFSHPANAPRPANPMSSANPANPANPGNRKNRKNPVNPAAGARNPSRPADPISPTNPANAANPAAGAGNRYPGLSGRSDPQPMAGRDAKSIMQEILRHLAKARRNGLHAKDWTWQEIDAEEIYANCTGSPFALKLVAKQLADHIGLICTDFDVQFVASSPNNAPAYVELGESRQGVTAFINIRYEVKEDDTALGDIIAHEICHAMLLVIDYPNKKSERATDLCAIALGLGPLIRDGKTAGRNLGYLSFDEIRQAMTGARELKGCA